MTAAYVDPPEYDRHDFVFDPSSLEGDCAHCSMPRSLHPEPDVDIPDVFERIDCGSCRHTRHDNRACGVSLPVDGRYVSCGCAS